MGESHVMLSAAKHDMALTTDPSLRSG